MTNEREQSSAGLTKNERVFLANIEDIETNDTFGLQKASTPYVTKKDLEESTALAKRVEGGRSPEGKLNEDALAARDELMFSCAGLVMSVAKKYELMWNIPREDLVQEGNIGLIRAVEKYDWRKGNVFSTYATHWIRQAIRKKVAIETGVTPQTYYKVAHLRKAVSEFTKTHGHAPNMAEICETTGLSAKQVIKLRNTWKLMSTENFTSLTSLKDDSDGESLEEQIEDREALHGHGLEQLSDFDKLRQILDEEISNLPPKMSEVLRLRFAKGLTLKAIGSHPDFVKLAGHERTDARIDQIKAKAINTLRKRMFERLGAESDAQKAEVRKAIQDLVS